MAVIVGKNLLKYKHCGHKAKRANDLRKTCLPLHCSSLVWHQSCIHFQKPVNLLKAAGAVDQWPMFVGVWSLAGVHVNLFPVSNHANVIYTKLALTTSLKKATDWFAPGDKPLPLEGYIPVFYFETVWNVSLIYIAESHILEFISQILVIIIFLHKCGHLMKLKASPACLWKFIHEKGGCCSINNIMFRIVFQIL